MRGRSVVPLTFLRTRQWRRMAKSCFFSVLMLLDHGYCRGLNSLLNGLAFLADNSLTHVTHALALIGLGGVIPADLGGHPSYHFLARPLDGELCVFLDGNFDLVR